MVNIPVALRNKLRPRSRTRTCIAIAMRKYAYHQSLLDRYEADSMNAIGTAMAAVSALPPKQALMALPSRVSFDTRLDAAVRGWAVEQPAALAVQARVDTARLDALVSLWRRILLDPAQARAAALVPHLLMIGASVAVPTPTEEELREVFSLLATLVPSVGNTRQ